MTSSKRSAEQLPLDFYAGATWWVIRPPGYDGLADGYLVLAWDETEARQKFGREIETIMPEDEWYLTRRNRGAY